MYEIFFFTILLDNFHINILFDIDILISERYNISLYDTIY